MGWTGHDDDCGVPDILCARGEILPRACCLRNVRGTRAGLLQFRPNEVSDAGQGTCKDYP